MQVKERKGGSLGVVWLGRDQVRSVAAEGLHGSEVVLGRGASEEKRERRGN